MRGRWLAGALAVLMLTPAALADVYEGATAANVCVPIFAESSGILEEMNVMAGSAVAEGDVISSVRAAKVFAAQDGTVARVHVDPGESADGGVLEVYPVERYQIYCTVDGADSSAQNMLVHSGEQVYIKCTANGTHRGVGIVTRIEGDQFRVLAIGGELYVGETVYLYRDESFSARQRVGIGTVVTNDAQVYASSGTVARIHVAEGEFVQRGELLYEVIDGENADISSPADGIVQEVFAVQGDCVEIGQRVASIVPRDQIVVEIKVDERDAERFSPGDEVTLTYAWDGDETPMGGTVAEILQIAQEGTYTVKIRPEDPAKLSIGMTATVRTGGDG